MIDLEAHMVKCIRYDQDSCDSSMCIDCPFLEKALRIEASKHADICPFCLGIGAKSGTEHQVNGDQLRIMSITRTCSMCGGHGRFNPYGYLTLDEWNSLHIKRAISKYGLY